jgi:transcription antitermination factor NusG
MSGLELDVQQLIDEHIEDSHERALVKDILDWEEEHLNQQRYGKYDNLEEYIEEYLNDKP